MDQEREPTKEERDARKAKARARAAALVKIPIEKFIKVGLDEWILVKRTSQVGMMTDGLLGCIGLVLYNADFALLSHVYSDCNDTNWNGPAGYEAELNAARQELISRGPITGSKLVFSGEGGPEWFRNQMKNWVGNAPVYEILYSSGMKVYPTTGTWVVERKTDSEAEFYRQNVNSANSSQYIVSSGFLSTHGHSSS